MRKLSTCPTRIRWRLSHSKDSKVMVLSDHPELPSTSATALTVPDEPKAVSQAFLGKISTASSRTALAATSAL